MVRDDSLLTTLAAVPYSKNPAPSQFTMPDFSKGQGGWGIGKNGSNVKFNLVVYEEYDDGFVSCCFLPLRPGYPRLNG